MKYYIREMKGSFEAARLLGIPNEKMPGGGEDNESEILAHCWQIPDSSLTHFLMPECTDFSPSWIKGPCFINDEGGLRAGHHCGEYTWISKEKAQEIIKMSSEEVVSK